MSGCGGRSRGGEEELGKGRGKQGGGEQVEEREEEEGCGGRRGCGKWEAVSANGRQGEREVGVGW